MELESLKDKIDVLSGRVLEPDAPPLSASEAREATQQLVKPLYKAIVRVKQDNVPSGQEFGLFSFTPARGVQPNKYGIYGTAKIRGCYNNPEVANDAAESIIRNIDSQNEIYTVKVGQEFPLTKEPKYVADFETVNLEKEVSQVEKQRKQEEMSRSNREKKLIMDRERKLLNEHKEILEGTYEEDPLDVYIRERVKKSQLLWTKENTLNKVQNEIEPALQVVKDKIKELDAKDPSLREKYLEKYIEARKEAGIETDFKETGTQQDFVKYLLNDEE